MLRCPGRHFTHICDLRGRIFHYAASTGGSSASNTVNSLHAQGYNVQVNGSVTAPLSECIVTRVHGDSGSTQSATVYVDISCPPSNN